LVLHSCVQQPPYKTSFAVFFAWPDGYSAHEIGKWVADRFVSIMFACGAKSMDTFCPLIAGVCFANIQLLRVPQNYN